MLAVHKLRYVETDLPGVHEERVELRQALEAAGKLKPYPNLIFAPANLMAASDRNRVLHELDPKRPVAIVHEGLFQYFSFEEKKEAALAIREILKRFGGVWMTPDFETRDLRMRRGWNHPDFGRIYASITRISRRDLQAFSFESQAEVKKFFDGIGMSVTTVPQIDGSYRLSSPRRVGTTADQLAALRETCALRVMRLK